MDEMKKCLICGNPIKADTDDDQICDGCELAHDELTNGKVDDDDE